MGVDESPEDGAARGFIEPPQPACLLGRQTQPGHLEKFSADSMDDLLDSPARLNHRRPQTFNSIDSVVIPLVCDSHAMPTRRSCKFGGYALVAPRIPQL